MSPPEGYYAQLMLKSGLTVTHKLEVKAEVIHQDFTGNVGVVLQNNSNKPINTMFALGIFICSIYKCSQHADVYVLNIKLQIITKSEQLCNIIVMYESYNEWHKLEPASDVEFDQFITYM